ncbi:Stress responsive A/B Barrel Domain protein [Planctomycetes bacterium Pan216]|uniref:Stress responsive A/B Barrel Domain protein n=1 Tax=Kolteria novifilia TaxID=2527975 RepID=A0A518BCS6_9BACT|nr:Stress responsive A/B Barrel Domain protein [Planctomycetes bacterium Pan216]
MVEHIVLFEIKEDASNESVMSMLEGLRRLKGEIPEIVELAVGRNFSDRGKSFEYGLLVRFESPEALEAYRKHPAHQDVLDRLIKPVVSDVLAVDFEW